MDGSTDEYGAAAPAEQAAYPRRSPTIHDVARAASVSIGTASKALNGRGQLRPETRQRVRLAAEQLGFRSNDLVHSLLRGRTFTVGLLSTDTYGRFSIPVLEGIEDALGAARISVFMCNARDDPARERRHIESLLAKKVDGIIVTGRRIDPRPPIDIGAARIPILYAFTRITEPGALCLLPDDAHGARLAAEHLVRAGRRRIAHITGPQSFEAVRLRAGALRDTLAEHDLDLPARRVLSGPWDENAAYDATTVLLDRDPTVDGIFCGSDLLARGVADALRERGRRVPDDVALVGFDNWEIIAAKTRPPLTTVDMELHELGRLAGTRLLEMIEGQRGEGTVRTPCRLVVRASCGATTITTPNILPRAVVDAHASPEHGVKG